MLPTIKNLSLWRGNTKTFGFRFKDSTNALVDLTGSVLVMTIAYDGGTLIKSSENNGIIIADPTTGYATVKFSADDTRDIADSPIKGVRYELERQTDDEQTTLLRGKITVEGGDNND